jgi:RHH-type transcriptional regulator, rel operon repressor / antitoxin RelB
MTESATLAVRLSPELRDSLAELARSRGRSEAELAAEAIAAYVEGNTWMVEEIERAVKEADAGGPFVPHEEVEAWVRSWGTENELPRPKARRMP